MKSKTSFFNPTALRKDILRYSPVWVLYTLALLLTLFAFTEMSRPYMAESTLDSLRFMAWLNLFYGGLCGVVLFSDLFKSRLCNALHAFPIRREGWLTTHILSGVLFSLVPNLLATVLGCIMLQEYAYLALIWLGVSTLQYLFFFGTAVLCAMCAGNMLGTVAIYGITHFITVFVKVVVDTMFLPLLYGVRLNTSEIYRFFPLDQLDGFDYAHFNVYFYEQIVVEYNGLNGDAWLYAGLCAAVGILCLVIACFVYRRRNLESAGDFVSLRPLAPFFLVVCSVGAGIFLYLFAELVGTKSYLFLVLGMVIGYFAGSMLLYRTLKVFGKKSILRFAVLVVALVVSLGLTWLDPLGITTYIPKPEKVKSATLWGADKGYYYLVDSMFSSYAGIPENAYKIKDPETLTELQDFHQELIHYRPSSSDGTLCDVRIQYTLNSGRTVTRYYEVGWDTDLGKRAATFFSDMRYVFEMDDTQILYDAFGAVKIDMFEGKENTEITLTDPTQIKNLLNAISKDCEAGKMAQNWAMHDESDKEMDINLHFTVKESTFEQLGWNTDRFYLHVYSDSVYTIAYIKQMVEFHSQQP